MRAQVGQLACETVDDGFLFLLELQMHLCGGHGAWVAHGCAARVGAGEVRREGWEGMGVLSCWGKCTAWRGEREWWRAHWVDL